MMVHDPVKDGLMFVTGQHAESNLTATQTAIRLLQEQLGMNYGPEAVEHLVTSPIDKDGVVTQIFVLSVPLNIWRHQYRTSQNAQRAIDAGLPLPI